MVEKSEERDFVVSRLAEDLIGPRDCSEVLFARPSDIYLTGILWPCCTQAGEDDEQLGVGGTGADDGVGGEEEAVSLRSVQKPSVAGVSFSATSETVVMIRIICEFACYHQEERNGGSVWIRKPYRIEVPEFQVEPGQSRRFRPEGLPENVFLFVRSVNAEGSLLITVSLVNGMKTEKERDSVEAASLFQTSIRVEPCRGTFLVPKPVAQSRLLRPSDTRKDDHVTDEESGVLLYRKVYQFAVGHVCSATWEVDHSVERPAAMWVATTWLPSSIVESVDPNGHQLFREIAADSGIDPLSAEDLALADRELLAKGLRRFGSAYERWIEIQLRRIGNPSDVSPELAYIAEAHLMRCKTALQRINSAIDFLESDDRFRKAFQMANYAMAIQHSWNPSKKAQGSLRWRPFQLGFLLLSAPSTVCRDHPDRGIMDLLWFPTGGGKTEAYLALVACTAAYRSLSMSGNQGGVCALMRYTLRLLTTQQFSRSAAMILALEAMRTKRVTVPGHLCFNGSFEFSIGLWVGAESTPNKRSEAYAFYRGGNRKYPSPLQLTRCPACGERLDWSMSNPDTRVVVLCNNDECGMRGPLPIYTVDEDIYEFRPTLLIGTADKFAQIVRQKQTNTLFGIKDKLSPDLVIQDELHLISGPLGTIAGGYEAAFDMLFSASGSRPKVIGSTATIRRAGEQVRALFDREAFQFPPPAVDYNDSGFAVTDRNAPGRRYVGVTTAGRSAKFTLQAVAASLLQGAEAAFDDPAKKDAYWTLLGYFNSIRELGGAFVLMHDDVNDSIRLYAKARGENRVRSLCNIEELTSRRTQEEIREMLDLLDTPSGKPGAVDVVLATNMVSVGVDISRLGLMLVNGQPKTISEYIQSTSRVGRNKVSGLVVSILNNAKARDRSHFETFCSWHQTLYRDVEATSVTPFAPRARDRVLHAALVAVVRHLAPDMLDEPCLNDEAEEHAYEAINKLAARAGRIDPEETEVQEELENILRLWRVRNPDYYWNDYKANKSLLQSAEHAAACKASLQEAGRAWPTLNSMRTVEAGTPFRMKAQL